jgi:HSP20 family protein
MLGMRDLIPWSRGTGTSPRRQELDHPLMSVQREIDRLFDDFWRGANVPGFGGASMISPRIDVSENEKEIVVTAELPGLEERDVEVLLADNALTLKGEKKAERNESEHGYVYKERSFGSFRRTLPLDAEVNPDEVDARFHNGVLTVTLPKSPEVQKKGWKIDVQGDVKQ